MRENTNLEFKHNQTDSRIVAGIPAVVTSLITCNILAQIAGASEEEVRGEIPSCGLCGQSQGNISHFCVLPDFGSIYTLLSKRFKNDLLYKVCLLLFIKGSILIER